MCSFSGGSPRERASWNPPPWPHGLTFTRPAVGREPEAHGAAAEVGAGRVLTLVAAETPGVAPTLVDVCNRAGGAGSGQRPPPMPPLPTSSQCPPPSTATSLGGERQSDCPKAPSSQWACRGPLLASCGRAHPPILHPRALKDGPLAQTRGSGGGWGSCQPSPPPEQPGFGVAGGGLQGAVPSPAGRRPYHHSFFHREPGLWEVTRASGRLESQLQSPTPLPALGGAEHLLYGWGLGRTWEHSSRAGT